jgi:hypothetical protein
MIYQPPSARLMVVHSLLVQKRKEYPNLVEDLIVNISCWSFVSHRFSLGKLFSKDPDRVTLPAKILKK